MEVSEAKRLRAHEDENAKLKRLLAEQMLDVAALRELLERTWMPAAKREAVTHLRTAVGLSERGPPSYIRGPHDDLLPVFTAAGGRATINAARSSQ